jgi:hypothetical protein
MSPRRNGVPAFRLGGADRAPPGRTILVSGWTFAGGGSGDNWPVLARLQRMRLYLLDLPGGSARILAIAIVAPEPSFERVVEAAAPIVDSFEFRTG